MATHWTDEEETILCESWGQLRGGIPALARKLSRSVEAVKVRAQRLKLGPWREGDVYVSLYTLVSAVTGLASGGGYSYTAMRWEKLGLPVRRRRTVRRTWRMVRIDDFWRWAEGCQENLDFALFEENLLGKEPDWAKEKRLKDRYNRACGQRYLRWSPHEDAVLQAMLRQGATWAELEKVFQHSGGAIRRRIYDLNLPLPRSMRGHGRETPWDPDELALLSELREQGYGIDAIAQKLGRTSQSVRGKLGCGMKRGANHTKESEKFETTD